MMSRAVLVLIALLAPASFAAAEEAPIRNISPRITVPVGPGNWVDYEKLKPPPEAARIKLQQIKVLRDGRLVIDSTVSSLEGIRLIEPKRICETPLNRKWACGVRAFMAWRAYFSKGVSCDVEGERASCRKGNEDAGVTLLAGGWAEPASGDNNEARRSAFQSAQDRHFGIFASVIP
ncbi:hypothetical protein IZ6_26790 [Terrihabitans soli]|uniref:Thermonuclease family protein n=1 Tax=Terrihabitans soli TaxID=708113 RepID=A0A6S6QN62_9HYPH|nr:hypothetical protein [Terrihabitans soli]BCJ91944.1 hypothetical protein IZ6_26790 [Terrihabitans soli]